MHQRPTAFRRHAGWPVQPPKCEIKSPVPFKIKKLLPISNNPGQIGRRYFPRKSLSRASSTTWSVDKIALTRSDCGAV
jgi:hypothetical protein